MRIKREVGKIVIGDACIFCGKWHENMTRIKTTNKCWSMHICRYCKKKLMEFWMEKDQSLTEEEKFIEMEIAEKERLEKERRMEFDIKGN